MKFLSILIFASLSTIQVYSQDVVVLGEKADVKVQKPLGQIELLNGALKLMVPSNLKRLSEAELSEEARSGKGQKPTYMFLDRTSEIKFSMNYGSSPAQFTDLPQIKLFFENIYKKASKNFISSDMVKLGDIPVISMKFELAKASGQGQIFNHMIASSIEGQLFIAVYSFPSELKAIEERKSDEVLKSIQIRVPIVVVSH